MSVQCAFRSHTCFVDFLERQDVPEEPEAIVLLVCNVVLHLFPQLADLRRVRVDEALDASGRRAILLAASAKGMGVDMGCDLEVACNVMQESMMHYELVYASAVWCAIHLRVRDGRGRYSRRRRGHDDGCPGVGAGGRNRRWEVAALTTVKSIQTEVVKPARACPQHGKTHAQGRRSGEK